MALGIPLPGSFGDALGRGLDTGSTLFQRMLAPKIQQAQMQQAWQQHLDNLAIQKQQQERLGLQEQRLGQADERAAELHPWEELFARNRAQYAYSPEQQQAKLDLVRAKEATERAKAEAARNKQPALTPQQKREERISEFKEKEQLKSEAKKSEDLFAPTTKIRNDAQKGILAINTVKPLLEDLMTLAVPGKFEQNFKPAKAAFATMLQNLGTEEFQSVFNLPKDQHSVKLVEKMVDRRMFESLDDYRARLKDLYTRIMHKGQMLNNVLENKTVKIDTSARKSESGSPKSDNDPLGIL